MHALKKFLGGSGGYASLIKLRAVAFFEVQVHSNCKSLGILPK